MRAAATRASPFSPAPRAATRRPARSPMRPLGSPRQVSIDFGDGESVRVVFRDDAEFAALLRDTGSAGVRRRGANGFSTNDAPLVRHADELNPEWEYLLWPTRSRPGS